MPLTHAVAWIDHHTAQVLQIDAEQVLEQKVKEHVHYTRQHGSQVRSEHEFFAEVCEALAGITSILVAGSHTAQADFRHYVEKHRPAVATQIVGWETVGHPTEGEIVKMAREFFVKRGELVAAPRMS
ncbi:MAG: hypothetical protein ABI702_22310 [Burkholderiales bacterium]